MVDKDDGDGKWPMANVFSREITSPSSSLSLSL